MKRLGKLLVALSIMAILLPAISFADPGAGSIACPGAIWPHRRGWPPGSTIWRWTVRRALAVALLQKLERGVDAEALWHVEERFVPARRDVGIARLGGVCGVATGALWGEPGARCSG